MQAPIEVSRRAVGEVFSLDILSHRMSAMAILHQLSEVSSVPSTPNHTLRFGFFFAGEMKVRADT